MIDEKNVTLRVATEDSSNIMAYDTKSKISIVIVSSFKPSAKDRVDLIKNVIIPMFNE